MICTAQERRLLGLLAALLAAGYALTGLRHLGLLPSGALGGAEPVPPSVAAPAPEAVPTGTAPLAPEIATRLDSLPATPGRVTGAEERASPFRDARLDLNAADSLDLIELPGIGPSLAGRILELRRQRGRFRSVAELREVTGIGEKRFARLAPLVGVTGPGNVH